MDLMLGYPDDLFWAEWPVPSVAGIAAEWHPSALSLSCKLSLAQEIHFAQDKSLSKASFHSVTARRSNLSTLNEITPEYSLEGLTLKLQYFDHLMQTAHSLDKTLMLGKIEGKRRRGWQKMVGWHHWLNGCEFEQILGDGGQESLMCCSPWGSQRVGHDWATKQQKQSLYLKLTFIQWLIYRGA